MTNHDIVVIGASAGGVEALTTLARALPADLPAALFVVMHFPDHLKTHLPEILNRAGRLRAGVARDGEPIEPGRIYVAQPGMYLLVKRGHVDVAWGPRENGARPAVDPLFRSAARAYGPRVVGVILSGALSDGTAGLREIKRRGGLAVVQDPADAVYPGMPASALAQVDVDYSVPLPGLGQLLGELVRRPAPAAAPANGELEPDAVEEVSSHPPRRGKPSPYSCPACHGVLWEMADGEALEYRCRVGHGYSQDGLLAAQADSVEDALWAAMRALEERAQLARRVAARLRARRANGPAPERLDRQAAEADQQADLLRRVLLERGVAPEGPLPA